MKYALMTGNHAVLPGSRFAKSAICIVRPLFMSCIVSRVCVAESCFQLLPAVRRMGLGRSAMCSSCPRLGSAQARWGEVG